MIVVESVVAEAPVMASGVLSSRVLFLTKNLDRINRIYKIGRLSQSACVSIRLGEFCLAM